MSLPFWRVCAPFGTCVLGTRGRCADCAGCACVHANRAHSGCFGCLLLETLLGVRLKICPLSVAYV